MKLVDELKKQRSALVAEMRTIWEGTELDGRNLNEDEQARWDKAEQEVDAIDSRIKRAAWLEPEKREQPQRPIDNGFQIGEITDMRDLPAEKPYSCFGEQLLEVRNACAPGAVPTARLMRAASGLNESQPADGGFLLQENFATEIWSIMHDQSPILGQVLRVPITGNSLSIPAINETSRADGSRWGGVSGAWAGEGATVTATKPAFAKRELRLNKLVAISYITEELASDAQALGGLMTRAFAEEIDFKVADAIINGDGSGKPQGILNAAALVSVAKETGQAAATVLYENVVKMWSRMHGKSRGKAVWLVNQDVEPQLHQMSLAVGTGGIPVYLPAGGLSASPYSSLFGRPVVPVEQCQTLGTAGDIILADLSQYILIDKGGPVGATSMHVRFIYGEDTFRMTYRVDGQSLWSSALTPAKGSNTQSPFVSLAVRS